MKDKIPAITLFGVVFILSLICLSCGNDRATRTRGGAVENDSVVTPSNSLPKPTYNTYIENSASMDGYVKGKTDFENAVYKYLSDIDIKDLTDSLNLFYINSKPIPHGSDIADFIEELEPSTFKQRGGNRGTTYISSLLDTVLNYTNDDIVSIVVSDFIFSPGKNVDDAKEYLINQQIGIKNNINSFLKKYPKQGVLIYHLESEFDGIFYDKSDDTTSYEEKRPYYIWIIGHKEHLKELVEKCPNSSFIGGGVKNTFSIIKGGSLCDYAIKHGSGNFRISKEDAKHSLNKLKKESRKGEDKATFNINVNFSEMLCGEDYLLDKANYELSDTTYTLDTILKRDTTVQKQWTHILRFSTEVIKQKSILDISLVSKVPNWVEQVTDNEGVGINENNKDKTFGFKYLVNGVYDGFTTANGEKYTTMTIKINH